MKKIFKVFIILIVLVLGIIIILRELYPNKYESIVSDCALKYELDEELIWATIKTESNFKSDAKSIKGALGLMQIMPDTGSWIAKKLNKEYKTLMLYEPEVNIEFGCWYLAYLIDKYEDVNTAMAAYNAGPGNVDEWLSEKEYSTDGKRICKIPFKETNKYVKKMAINSVIYKIIY